MKYHATSLVVFWRFHDDATCEKLSKEDTYYKAIEEVLAQIDKDIPSGRMCFPLKDLHEEVCRRKEQFGDPSDISRTRLKEIFHERFPVLKEELRFRRKVILVTISTMILLFHPS